MGWDYITSGKDKGKPQLYILPKSEFTLIDTDKGSQEVEINTDAIHRSTYSGSTDGLYYSWASAYYWNTEYVGLKYTNDSGEPVQIQSLGIKTTSCNSGFDRYGNRQTFVAYSGGYYSYVGPALGYGGRFFVFILVKNPDSKPNSFELLNNQLHSATADGESQGIPSTDECNMLSRGTTNSPQQTASFDTSQIHTYTIPDCPIIKPDGVAYVMMGINRWNSPNVTSSNTYIKFILDPSEMEVQIDQGIKPYIWEYCSDGQWHLQKRLWSKGSDGWDLTDDIGGFH